MIYYKFVSPGRVNLIGEHTDHQGGLVFPLCIDKSIIFYAIPRDDDKISVYTKQFDDRFKFSIKIFNDEKFVEKYIFPEKILWRKYLLSVIYQFYRKTGQIISTSIYLDSQLPVGSGLSSSAAFEMGILSIFEKLANMNLDHRTAIDIAWFAENKLVGMPCGIMDQSIIRLGKYEHGVILNCSTRDYKYIRINDNMFSILIVDTGVQRNLIETPYNDRIIELKNALSLLKQNGYAIDSLSELTIEDLVAIENRNILDNHLFKRVKHVITENNRVRLMAKALSNNNIKKIGELLYQSHYSLKDNFNASWDEADEIIKKCKEIDSVIGARMLGAGWGGTVLIIYKPDQIDNVIKNIHSDKYNYINCNIADGVHGDIIQNIPDSILKLLLMD